MSSCLWVFKNGTVHACADPENFVRVGPTLTTFFFLLLLFFSLMRGGRIQKPLLAGHQRPGGETPFK